MDLGSRSKVDQVPCFRPKKAWKDAGGRLVFRAEESDGAPAFCIPCGKCVGCQAAYKQSWMLRCVHEAQMHERNCFITLTYDDEHLPEDLSVDVREWQLFAKRLRKKVGPLRYFCCGEYGERNKRPHYHAILFGQDFAEDRVFEAGKNGHRLYTSGTLSRVWKQGFCSVGEFSPERAGYVAGYCLKKFNGPPEPERRYGRSRDGVSWQVQPEFATMSRRPGIGSRWIEKFKDDVWPWDYVVHDGRKFRPPSFYSKVLPPHELERIKANRRGHMESPKVKENNTEKVLKRRERKKIRQTERKLRSL